MNNNANELGTGSVPNNHSEKVLSSGSSPSGQNEQDPYYNQNSGKSSEIVTFLGLTGVKLNLLIAICAGVGFVLFGYDQGVMGSLLTLPPFRMAFPQIDITSPDAGSDPRLKGNPHNSSLQGATIGIYEIGCFVGAVSCIIWGNTLGRRRMIWIGSM